MESDFEPSPGLILGLDATSPVSVTRSLTSSLRDALPKTRIMNWATMRVLICCLLAVATTTTLAPTSDDLRRMYGASTDVVMRSDGTPNSESFLLSPNIKLTAQYGSDRQACTLALEPGPVSDDHQKDGEQLMSPVRISEILKQVAPADKRGEQLPSRIDCAGSIGIWSDNYANVYIRHDFRCEEGLSPEKRVRVNFKREVCPKFDH